eukprot:CAMPEP_0176378354 /NCGR_PEP_ID=MMETSP0126-20121128/29557_1 /TAXON_ID=141414 ORGANISM="Strombidinopsis acuminatum, Strain SPMC142" /NCGR_SAMPLE_ID=MMETSP0126 /ASSEMBLY_ACC=CAM_ASM_000229 /LENGTH=33 /DNA_ID= /DNA_START= /DNA_END= /DNA_ORIENTATION=
MSSRIEPGYQFYWENHVTDPNTTDSLKVLYYMD